MWITSYHLLSLRFDAGPSYRLIHYCLMFIVVACCRHNDKGQANKTMLLQLLRGNQAALVMYLVQSLVVDGCGNVALYCRYVRAMFLVP
jgi:hypothetical protein